jgi:hypothetical protein
MTGDVLAATVASLLDVVRSKGCLRGTISTMGAAEGGVFLKFELEPAPEARPIVEAKAEAPLHPILQRKRDRLRRDLGRYPTDDELERLP